MDDFQADPMYEEAVAIVRKWQRASISLVQRHLRIGYHRSERLLEAMEHAGVVSAKDSAGVRSVLPETADKNPLGYMQGRGAA